LFTIVDIETTGAVYNYGKITEIAILVHNGEYITDSFQTLINPGIDIPIYITRMTGITNQMVRNAPGFFEVAGKIVELTEGRTFVAHNVQFDYRFIQEEFKSLGYDYVRKKLCTVELSRKLIPGLRSYSLGSLCKSLGIVHLEKHRAAGDAMATARLFDILLAKHRENGLLPRPGNNYCLF
jgi:DNA polymerase-3 subunit epsilon